jgi:hypothetical protein
MAGMDGTYHILQRMGPLALTCYNSLDSFIVPGKIPILSFSLMSLQ